MLYLFIDFTLSLNKYLNNPYILFNSSEIGGSGCYRIPSLVTTLDGTLLAFADMRPNSCWDMNINNDIKIALRSSKDSGKTWSPVKIIIDHPVNISTSDPSTILNTQTGEIVLIYNLWDWTHAKGVYKQFVTISSDNGNTWCEPFEITDQIAPPESEKAFKFITSGKGVQAKNGYLYQTLVHSPNGGVWLIESQNGGRNWTRFELEIKPASETNIAALNNGNLILNSRTSLGHRYLYEIDPVNRQIVRSEERPDLPDPSCNGGFMNYFYGKSNILFFSNAASSSGRINMTIRYSLDEGHTFSKGKVVYPKNGGYSSLAITKYFELAMFYEYPDKNGLAVEILRMNWVMDQ